MTASWKNAAMAEARLDFMVPGKPAFVLASQSRVRATMLANAGLNPHIEPAHVDEDEVKHAMKAEGAPPAHIAETLAEMKALKVSHKLTARGITQAMVLGADQMLDCNGVLFDKPEDLDHAKAHLKALSGKTHALISAAVVARDGQPIWRHIARARLTVRPLSDGFIDAYLDAVGELALTSVGAYQVEGLGIHLFSAIEGHQSVIQGLPLLELLDFLRANSMIPQ